MAPHARDAGVGSALLDRTEEELASAAIDDVLVGAFVTNADAIRLYQRRGFRPTWMYLQRLSGRSA